MSVELAKFGKEEVPAVTSLDVAKAFGKRHSDVLRAYRSLGCSQEFLQSNFALQDYTSNNNHKQHMLIMTRDGFMMLVMGFTGAAADSIKEEFIKQFNAMEKALRSRDATRLKAIVVRKELTKAIKESGEAARTYGYAYPQYTNLVYTVVLGMTADQKKRQLGLKKSQNLRDYLEEDELNKIKKVESMVTTMVDAGLKYQDIRDFLKSLYVKALQSGVPA